MRRTYLELEIAPGLVICATDHLRRLNDTDWALPWDSV